MTRAARPRKTVARAARGRAAGKAASAGAVLAPVRCAQGDDLWRFLDAELPATRARAVATHVTGCPTCAARARRLRAMLDECRAVGCQELPPHVRARARARVRALVRAGRR